MDSSGQAGGLSAGLVPGSRVAGYRLEGQLGAGGMAVVFRARDERLRRMVALKVLAPGLAADAGFRERFVRESQAAAAVDDPHILPVYEAGEADGVLFIAMRFVADGDLGALLAREGPLAAGRAAGFVTAIASALDTAHAAGLVHRDVKPGNVLLDARPGRPDHVYLSDFGLSKGALWSGSLTGSGVFLGTAAFSAPEQISGRAVDGRADQYALACVAFMLLTGVPPFERDPLMAVLWAQLSEPPPSLASLRPDLPAAVDGVLGRALAKEPRDRYPSCGEFAAALRDALGGPASGLAAVPALASPPGQDARPGAARAHQTPPPTGQADGAPAQPRAAAMLTGMARASASVMTGDPRITDSALVPSGHFETTSAGKARDLVTPDSARRPTWAAGVSGRLDDPDAQPSMRAGDGPLGPIPALAGPVHRRGGMVAVAAIVLAAGALVATVLYSPVAHKPSFASGRKAPPARQTIGVGRIATFTIHYGHPLGSAALSPDGKTLAAGDANGSTYLWDLAARTRIATLIDTSSQGISDLAFSPDGKALAAGDGNGSTYLWDVATGARIATLTDPASRGVLGMAFSPDGKILAVGDGNGIAYLWDVASRVRIAALTDPASGGVLGVAFSPDGKILAVGDGNGIAYLWDVASRVRIVALADPGRKGVFDLAFSPDGKILAVGDGNGIAYLWDVASRVRIAALTHPGSRKAVYDLAFSPDGKILAVADVRSGSYLWDVVSRARIVALTDPGSKGAVGVAFSPDGKTLAVGDRNGSTYLWGITVRPGHDS